MILDSYKIKCKNGGQFKNSHPDDRLNNLSWYYYLALGSSENRNDGLKSFAERNVRPAIFKTSLPRNQAPAFPQASRL
jgi:hypothetical protein